MHVLTILYDIKEGSIDLLKGGSCMVLYTFFRPFFKCYEKLMERSYTGDRMYSLRLYPIEDSDHSYCAAVFCVCVEQPIYRKVSAL